MQDENIVDGHAAVPQAPVSDVPAAQHSPRTPSTDNGAAVAHAAPARALRDYMLAAKRWVVWEADKQPFYVDGTPRRGTLDTPEDIARLGTVDDANRVVRESDGRFIGVGFALGPDGTGGYWQGGDLDDIEENHLSDLANYAPGYVELSPSGKGIHVIGYGRHFATLGSNGTGIEAYASGRYFTYTGQTLRDAAPICLAAWVEGALAPRHSASRSPSSPTGTVWVDPKTVTELRSALNAILAEDYHQWIKIGRCLYELGPVGRELWLTWSQNSPQWNEDPGPVANAKKWDTFKGSSAPYQTIFKLAQEQGWVNPMSKAAQVERELTPEELFQELSFDWDSTEPMAPDLVLGLIADEEVTLLGGHGGIGKGFLSLQIACAVAAGRRVLGYPSNQHRVLYYSAEDGRKRIGFRLRRLLESYTDEERELIKKNLRVIDASDLDPLFGETAKDMGDGETSYFVKILGPLHDYGKLQKMVEAFDPQLVVIDGASDTFDGNEIARRDVRGFVKLLRRVHPKRRIGVLLIVHIDRASARGHTSQDDGYAGNAQWHNSCRRRLYLQRKVERDEETREEIAETILLRVMKNQDAPPEPDMEVLRQKSGFWQQAVTFTGTLSIAGPTDYSATIFRLMREYYERGQYISTSLAANATTGVHAVLHGDPSYPRMVTKRKLANIVIQLEAEGKLEKETYKNGSRKYVERWKPVLRSPSSTPPPAEA